MSFILDALKKSETERQRQNAPGFADVPDSTEPPRAPRWLWVLGGLLAINLVVLIGVMFRPDLRPVLDVPTPDEAVPASEPPGQDASFSEIVEQAKRQQPKRQQPVTDAPVEKIAADQAMAVANLYATFNELRANGTLVLPDLHLDIHVYSDQPEERFVFVNMTKYREQARLAEGPLVKEITPEGVILQHLGNDFILPRE